MGFIILLIKLYIHVYSMLPINLSDLSDFNGKILTGDFSINNLCTCGFCKSWNVHNFAKIELESCIFFNDRNSAIKGGGGYHTMILIFVILHAIMSFI